MSRDGSGGYSLPVNTWNPATNGVSATAADWQALISDIASAVQQSLSADGQTPVTGSINMGSNRLTGLAAGTATGHSLRWEQLFSQGLQQDVAAGTTTDIGAALSTLVNVTGTGTITSFGTNYNGPRFLRFSGVCTLTNSATMVLPGGTNITTEAGDSAIAVPLGNPATGWRVAVYQSAIALVNAHTHASSDLTTAVPVSRGGTGQTTASAAFDALKQAATELASGVVELATTAEVEAGTDTTRAVTPAGLRGGLNVSGSAPIYACRAWVNFNGTRNVTDTGASTNGQPVLIRGSGNVTSVVKNSTGDYTVNLETAMPDANYAVGGINNNPITQLHSSEIPTTSSFRIYTTTTTVLVDAITACVQVFR